MGVRETTGTVLVALAAALLLWGYLRVLFKSTALAWSEPGRFPIFEWRLPEALFTLGLSGFFLAGALASFGGTPGVITVASLQASLALYAAIVLLAVGFLVFRNHSPADVFGLKPEAWLRTGAAAVGGLLLALPAVYGGQFLGYQLAGPDSQAQPIVQFLVDNKNWDARLMVVLVGAIAAPVAEEVVFRGCLYGVLRQWWGRLAALGTSSLVFALIHGHVASLPALFLLAAALVLIYEAAGTLWAPIAAHALFNGINIVAATQWPDLMK